MRRSFIRWTLIGLLIRFLIMPFSFHGHDIFFIYYNPFKFLTQGAWDPYLWTSESFPQSAYNNLYFPPGMFFIISGFLYSVKFLLPLAGKLFSLFEAWNFTWEGNTVHFARLFTDCQLFRTLFIFKLPYLFFDFATGLILARLLLPDDKNSLFAYKVWMLNPFVLHGCYALGQIDIIPAFFVMAAVYFMSLKRGYAAVLSLSSGILTKTLPVLVLPFAVILSAGAFKERLKLFLAASLPAAVIIAVFYFSSGNAVIEALFFSPGEIAAYRLFVFAAGYIFLFLFFFFISRRSGVSTDIIAASFAVVLLLFFSTYKVTIRYFIIVTPLLIYLSVKNRKFWVYIIFITTALFALRISGNTQQWGLFAALAPEFLSSLPVSDSYLNLAVNVLFVHKIMYRVFILFSMAMVVHILISYRHYLIHKMSLPE